jgi:hypothetical protein
MCDSIRAASGSVRIACLDAVCVYVGMDGAYDVSGDRDRRIHWILRIGVFLCFVGHGAFGIIGKEAWLPYFGVVGIGHEMGWRLEPIIGTVDIVIGFLVLIRPRPVVLLYATIWAVWTALLRPFSGEPFWEALERAGNYGVPFALLMQSMARTTPWFAQATPRAMDPGGARRLTRILIGATALLLIGHGMLALTGKQGLVSQHALLVGSSALTSVRISGAIEVLLALLIVVWPTRPLALTIFAWKLVTESLFLVAGAPIWELVERGGSYAAPLALAFLLPASVMVLARQE